MLCCRNNKKRPSEPRRYVEKCKNLYDALVKECAENGDIENTIKLAELRLKLQLSRAKTGEMFTPDEIETLLKGVKEKKEKDKI